MAIEYCLDERIIKIDDNNFLIIKTKVEENYIWNDVFLRTNDEILLIGSYSRDNGEKMDYNSNYIIFLKSEFGYGENYIDYRDDDFGYLGKRITKIFDIKNKRFVTSKDEVLSIYNGEFNHDESEEKIFYNEISNIEEDLKRIRNKD